MREFGHNLIGVMFDIITLPLVLANSNGQSEEKLQGWLFFFFYILNKKLILFIKQEVKSPWELWESQKMFISGQLQIEAFPMTHSHEVS